MSSENLSPQEIRQQKSNRKRLVAVIALILVAASAFSYGVGNLLKKEDGYRTVQCTAVETNCSSEFIFTYNLGVSGISPTAEFKAVTNLYNEQATYYYRLFHSSERFDDLVNVAALNDSPNTEFKIDEKLFSALKTASEDELRTIFLGPVFAYYETLFASSFDEDAATWDPSRNADLKEEFSKTLSFARDEKHISIRLKPGNKVALIVSSQYLDYANETGITSFIDFYWTKNAYIADFLAEDMIAAGYYYGVISSRDGFIRNTDPGNTEFIFNVFDEKENVIDLRGDLVYNGKSSIVSLHSFAIDEFENNYVYYYSDGDRATKFISSEDGLSRTLETAVAFSKEKGCAEILMSVLPYCFNGSVSSFNEDEIGILYSDGGAIKEKPLSGFTFSIPEAK